MDRSPERDSPATQTNNARGTFLIVEDEQLMLRLLEKVLLDHGSKVFTAADGEEAIAVYRRHKQEINFVNKPYMPENVVEILQSLVEQRSKII